MALLQLTINVPTVDDFADRYPQYGSFARGPGRPLFDLLTSPTEHLKAKVATEDLDLPAVAGVAKDAYQWVQSQTQVQWDKHLRQFIGAVVCASMEDNGFAKTGTKRAIPHRGFVKGEFYQRQP